MTRPILLDGSAGTALWAMAEAKGIERRPVWAYNIEHPELVLELHRRYINAGSQMIQTNTFSANPASVARSSDYSCGEIIRSGVRLAKKAAEGSDVKVYLSSGPMAELLEPFGRLTREKASEAYTEICSAAADEGVDYIMLETFMDIEMMKIAAGCAVKTGVKTICSMTFEKRRRTMMGNSVSQIVEALEPLGICAVGMNCSFGPAKAIEIIKEYSEKTSLPLYFKPNSGMTENYTAEQFVSEVAPVLDTVGFIGGCCGCDEEYIRALGKIL